MFVLMLTSLSRLAIYISGRGGQGGLRHLQLQGALRPSTYKISIVVLVVISLSVLLTERFEPEHTQYS